MAAMSWPCWIMPEKSVAVTSPLTGPLTMPQIFLRLSRKSPGSFARSDGFVVTPSRMPSAAIVSMSLMLPVSTNSFITTPSDFRLDGVHELADAFHPDRHGVAAGQRPDAGWRAGCDDVARLERHDERDEFDDVLDGKNQMRRRRRLPPFAVHPALN